MVNSNPSRLAKTMLDMRRVGAMDAATHEKITPRHLGDTGEPVAAPITGDETPSLREEPSQPGRVCAVPQSYDRLCFAVGAWHQEPDEPMRDITKLHNVSYSTISRLAA